MMIGYKTAAKQVTVAVIVFCAVLVCTMFLQFDIDLASVKEQVEGETALVFYEAQSMTSKVVCLCTGGCLLLTSAVTLLFACKRHIDERRRELGVLKALGYSAKDLSRPFWVFGCSVLIGGTLGYVGAWILMPTFYEVQNKDGFLPPIPLRFHPSLFVFLVLLPALFFSLLSVLYAYRQLQTPVTSLWKEKEFAKSLPRKREKEQADPTTKNVSPCFVRDMRKSTLRSRKTLVFFIAFASFCFASLMQMSYGMKDYGGVMMQVMMLIIGLVLSCTTLLLAVRTAESGNRSSLALMSAFGYTRWECRRAVLGAYAPAAMIGFVLGTGYQYALLRVMVNIVYRDVSDLPALRFDVPAFFVTLVLFVLFYEAVLLLCERKTRALSFRQTLSE